MIAATMSDAAPADAIAIPAGTRGDPLGAGFGAGVAAGPPGSIGLGEGGSGTSSSATSFFSDSEISISTVLVR